MANSSHIAPIASGSYSNCEPASESNPRFLTRTFTESPLSLYLRAIMLSPLLFKTLTVGSISTVLLSFSSAFPTVLQPVAPFSQALELTAPAIAADAPRYNPPTRPGPKRTAGTGSRGCSVGETSVVLTPVVPSGHIGQTSFDRPSFFWHQSATKLVHFTLVEPGVPKPLFEKTVRPGKAGMVRLDLPEQAPKLAVGKEYRWTIGVVCNPNRPSETLSYTQSWIARADLSTALKQQLTGAKTDSARARLYAEAGMWYDAMAILSKAVDANPKNTAAQSDLIALLDQVGLSGLTPQLQKSSQASMP